MILMDNLSKNFQGILIVVFSVAGLIIFFLLNNKLSNIKNKSDDLKEVDNKYSKWRSDYREMAICVILGILCIGFALILCLNLFYLSPFFRLDSVLGPEDGFSLLVAFLTLMATVIIAALQLLNQRGETIKSELLGKFERKKRESKEFSDNVKTIVSSIENYATMYNFMYKNLKINCCEFRGNIDTENYILIKIPLKSSLNLYNCEVSKFKIFNNNVDSVFFDVSYQIEPQNGISLINISIFDEQKVRIPKEAMCNFLKGKNATFGIQFSISERNDDDNSYSYSCVIKIYICIETLSLENPIIKMDGVCKLRVLNTVCKFSD